MLRVAVLVLSLQLAEAEVSKVVLDPKEYETSQWLEPTMILDGHFHPALKFAVRSLLAQQKMEALKKAVLHKADDGEVASPAKELVQRAQADPKQAGESDYKVIAQKLQYECNVTTTFA